MAFRFWSHWNLPFGYFIYDLMNILTKNILAKTTWFFQASGLEFQTFHVDLSSLSDLENEGLLVETFNVHYFTTHAHAILPCRYMWSPCTVQEIVKMGKKVYTHMLLLLILLTQKCTQKELWKSLVKLQVKENLSMELKAHHGFVDSSITILSMGRE